MEMKKSKGPPIIFFRKPYFPNEEFPPEDYYKHKNFEDVFKEIRKDIDSGFYEWRISADHVTFEDIPFYDIHQKKFLELHEADYLLKLLGIKKDDSPENLTKALKKIVPICPDLFSSNSDGARKLVAHFGKIINQALHSEGSKERKEAEDNLGAILKRPKEKKWKKVIIPPAFSFTQFFNYLHEITKDLREEIEYGDLSGVNSEDLADFKETKPGLVEIYKLGLIDLLTTNPAEVTYKIMASFFNLTAEGLKQKVKKERKFLKSLAQ
jgi:hypothetical protein